MDQTTTADPRCTCLQVPHLQACRIEVERRELSRRILAAAMGRMEDKARGFRLFPSAAGALRWYHARLRQWSAPRGLDLEAAANGGGRSTSTHDPRRVFASVAYAIREAERDAAERGGAPVGKWLDEHYRGGRSYAFIAEAAGGDVTEPAVLRAMSRAHRVIRARLERGGVLEGDGGDG